MTDIHTLPIDIFSFSYKGQARDRRTDVLTACGLLNGRPHNNVWTELNAVAVKDINRMASSVLYTLVQTEAFVLCCCSCSLNDHGRNEGKTLDL